MHERLEGTATMTHPSAIVLAGLIGWTLALVVLMELIRGYLVMSGAIPANRFTPDNGNLSPFMQRLARAHANCLEGLPIFGGLILLALVTGQTAVTDPLAYVLLGARIVQSLAHLASGGIVAVYIRFGAFAVQLIVAAVWCWTLINLYLQ